MNVGVERVADSSAELADPTSLASRLTVMSIACALFMSQIDSTAITMALPTLAQAFHTNPVNLKVALTCYIITQAIFIPASGWVADRYGARRVFMWSMGVFLAGSVLCGLSHSLGELVAARILQGLGGAAMMPVGRIIVVGAFRREDLVQAMVWLTMPALVGPILGPPLAGLILSFTDWPWIFFINVPFGLIGLICVLRFVPSRRQPHPGPFDMKGFSLSALAMSATMFAAESLGLLPMWVQVSGWLAAAGLWTAYVRHARGQARPILDLSLLRYKTLRANITGGALGRFSLGATPFLLPLLLQGDLGWTPLNVGLISMAGAVGSFLARPGAPYVMRRLGFRSVLLITSLVGGLLALSPLALGWGAPIWVVVALLAASGLIRAYQFTALNAVGFAEIPDETVSRANTLMSVAQQVAISGGITVAGLLLHLSQVLVQAQGATHLRLGVFVLPFLVVGLTAMSASLVYVGLPKDGRAGRAEARSRD
jgi:EmrB/QacA subfamily drug resistance transporter